MFFFSFGSLTLPLMSFNGDVLSCKSISILGSVQKSKPRVHGISIVLMLYIKLCMHLVIVLDYYILNKVV